MRTDLYTTVTPDAFIIIKADPATLSGDRLGRTVFPALPAELAYRVVLDRPLHEISPHEPMKAFRAEDERRDFR